MPTTLAVARYTDSWLSSQFLLVSQINRRYSSIGLKTPTSKSFKLANPITRLKHPHSIAMRLSPPPTLLSLLFTILASTTISNTKPTGDRILESQYHYLSERSCAGTTCGWSGQLCCTSGQTCTTNAQDQAECVGSSDQQANAQNGQWQYYTTTYVETDLNTITSTYSSFFAAASTAAVAPAQISCDASLNESPCGTICCAVGQYCAAAGYCAASNAQGESSSAYVQPVGTTATNTAFIRPTSNAATTITTTGSATTTVPFQTPTNAAATTTPAAPTASNNGLGGGAIAGIVIGVLAAIILLILFCACFCAKGLLDGLLAFLGLRNNRRRREETTIIESHHSHHGAGGGGGTNRRWFGVGPARVDRPKKKDSGIGGFTAVAAALTGLAVLLGLKRRRDERRRREKSDRSSEYSYSDTYDSYSYTSPCEC